MKAISEEKISSEEEIQTQSEQGVEIKETAFWKVWNALRETEEYFLNLDTSKFSEDQKEEANYILDKVSWGLCYITKAMQKLKYK
jgi:uncharacterized lipoprotein YehR (DUF1307 family)